MPKQPWDTFVTLYPNAATFTALVSPSLPRGAAGFDAAGRRLPTPYSLLVKWLQTNLRGGWTSTTRSGVVFVKVSDPTDEAAILRKFPAVGAPRATPVSTRTVEIRYRDSSYTDLAVELGYQHQ